MRPGRAGRSRRVRNASRDLEALVRTVAALDGARAAGLLAGLSEERRRVAVGLLRRVERVCRAERHARLARALAPDASGPELAEGISGALGDEVRRSLVSGASPDGDGLPPALAGWARRLVRELREV